MKLLVENSEDIKTLVESSDDGKRTHYLSGVFMQAEEKNRNGRVYPEAVLSKETERYINEKVKSQRALGELNHPADPMINLERVSHLVTELNVDGHNVMGKAKVLDTPCGNIVKGLVDGGVKLGVSSRGVGSLTEKNGISLVGDDYQLAAIDIVYDPSAPKALVDMVMESVDWIWNEETKSFMRTQAEITESNSTHPNMLGFLDTLVEIKSEIKNLQDRYQVLDVQNRELKSLVEDYQKDQQSKRELKLEQLLEDTRTSIEKTVKQKLHQKREEETLKLFEEFMNKVSKA